MAENAKSTDIAKMSFEDALAELEEIVRALEGGKGKLEEAITAYERGAQLKAHCEKKLKEAQAKVEKISIGAGGEVETEPANID
jgi:exodeoxyribonuclease VII small subunit